MGNKLRSFESDAIYMVGSRCFQARYLLRPSPEVNKIILGILAYLADKYDIEVFGFVFMSNHYHLIVRAQCLNLHHFMRDLNSQLAKRLNKHWGREGSLFGRRYTPTKLADDPMQIEKLCYTLCNPCLSNLVRHPSRWPGLSSWSIHKTGEPLVGERLNSEEYWRLKRKKTDMTDEEIRQKATVEYELHMAKLPIWEGLDDETYRQMVCEVVEEYAEHIEDERSVPCLGAQKVCAQNYYDRPKNPKKSPRPGCLASDPKLVEEFEEALRVTTDSYRKAVGELRKGRTDVEFPYGTIPPGHLCCVGAPRPRDELPAA